MDDHAIKTIETALPRMRDRWLGGGDAGSVAPPDWAGGPMSLLALAGQALEVLRTPMPAGRLTARAPLPHLALPALLDERRMLLRRALTANKSDPNGQTAIIRLLAARGFVAHPEDWRPGLNQLQDIDIYAPWAAWREGSASRIADDIPTAATWSDWSWTERRNALFRLRASDPAAGRMLLQAVFPAEPAEKRLTLLGALAKGLGPDDTPFLEGLGADRSDKVKQLAKRMLARVGRVAEPGEAEAELADFFDTGRKGILRRMATVSIKPIKTPAQRQRLLELLDMTTLSAFAAKLVLSEDDLVNAWQPSQQSPDTEFATLVLLTGSPAAVDALVARVEDDFPLSPYMAATLNELAPDAYRNRLIAAALRRESDTGFSTVLILALRQPGAISRQALEQTSAWKDLIVIAKAADQNDERGRNHHVARGLAALGLLCTSDGAGWVIETFASLGLSHADPVLNVLALNAALNERPPA
jgi:hypothetical protein